MKDLEHILQPGDEPDHEELIRYLEGSASEEERFAIEKQMADSSFVNDAVEGLQGFADPAKLEKYTKELNRQLQKQTGKRLSWKNKRRLKEQNWLLIAILGILMLCVFGYLAIHFYSKG